MVKLIRSKPKWLAALIILVLAALIITGCPSPSQPPVNQPTVNEPPVNQPPVIDRLFSEYRQVKRSTATPVECSARDPDGDELGYSWSAAGGTITGEGAAVSWAAPEKSGTYTITVTVADGRGGQATETIDIKAACCPIKADE